MILQAQFNTISPPTILELVDIIHMENNEQSATDPNDNLKTLQMLYQYKVKHVDNNLVATLNDEQLTQHHFTTYLTNKQKKQLNKLNYYNIRSKREHKGG